MANESATDLPATSWREQAVARSLGSARARAESRVQRFLDAALELMSTSPVGKDFTVQEVVERSGQSLRSFYQYFGGKQELLLALFEESVRSTADVLRERVAGEPDVLERLHRFVVDYHRLCRSGSRAGTAGTGLPTPWMAEFAQQLLTAHPAEAARAFSPIVALFDEALAAAVEAGVVRSDVQRRRVTGVVLEAVMFDAFSATIGGTAGGPDGDPAEELWVLVVRGIGSSDRR